MKKKYLKWLGRVALLALIVIQFFRIDKTNPSVDVQNDFLVMTNATDEISALVKAACYDCHSNETVYPWYTNVAPLSFWIKGHIDHGRQKLNFSDWGTYSIKKRNHKLEECVEEVKERHMPLKSYTWTHKDAKLSDDEVIQLSSWFSSLTE